MTELEQLKTQWRHCIEDKGGHCPVCSRWGKIYKRQINKTMAESLIWLAKARPKKANGEWIDIANDAPRWLVRSNQLSTLKWWGLVERQSINVKNKTKFSGLWKVTEKGRKFACREIAVPRAVYTYNDEVEDFSQETIFIEQAFKDFFDYKDVMNHVLKKYGDDFNMDMFDDRT